MWTLSPSRIATQDARRQALVLSEVGGEGAPIDSGWMACDDPGSWADYAAGLGQNGPVDCSTLDALVDFYRTRDRRPRIQVTPHQDPSLLRGLEARGFTVYEEDSILACDVDNLSPPQVCPGLTFRSVDGLSDADVAAFRRSQITGFYGDREPPAAMLAITERVARLHRTRLWLLEYAGQIVGSGGLEIYEDTAVLIAGCVHADARRQGIHAAFIGFRMAQAKEANLRMVTVGSTPGGPTERNAIRAGFSAVYTQIGLELR